MRGGRGRERFPGRGGATVNPLGLFGLARLALRLVVLAAFLTVLALDAEAPSTATPVASAPAGVVLGAATGTS